VLRLMLAGTAGTLFLLFAALLLASGPAFPWALRTVATKLAGSQGLSGAMTVRGSFWRGFSVHDLSFEGEGTMLRSVQIGELQLDYGARRLLTRAAGLEWLEGVRLRGLALELELPAPGEASARERRGWSSPTASDFSPLWTLLDSRIDLAGIDLTLRQGERTWRLEGLELLLHPDEEPPPGTVASDSDTGSDSALRVAALYLPDSESPVALSASVSRGERRLELSDLRLGGREEIVLLTVAEPDPGVWEATTRIEAGGGAVNVFASTAGRLLVEMPRGGTLDLAKAAEDNEGDSPLGLVGSVSDLHFEFEGDFDDPSSWRTHGRLVASGLRWQALEIDTLALVLRENRFSIELLSDLARLRASATLPFDDLEVEAASGGADWTGFAPGAEAELSIPSLATLAEALGESWPEELRHAPGGSLEARLEGFRWQGGRPVAGRAELVGESLTWQGIPLEDLLMEAVVIEGPLTDQVRLYLALRAAVNETNALEVSARMDLESFRYEAEARAVLSLADGSAPLPADRRDRPRELLAAAAPGLAIIGEGELEWSGSGSLRDGSLLGGGSLDLRGLRLSEARPMDLSGRFSHDAAGLEVPELALRSESLALGGALSLGAGRLELSDWSLAQDGFSRLELSASLPLPAPSAEPGSEEAGDSPPAAAPSPLALSLSMDDLDLGSLLDHFLDSPPLRGRLRGSAETVGTTARSQTEARFHFQPDEGLVGTLAGEDAAFSLELTHSGALAKPESWETSLAATLDGLQWNDQQLGQVRLGVSTEGGAPAADAPAGAAPGGSPRLVASLEAQQSGARLAALARLDLAGAESLADLASRPLAVDATLEAPEIEALWNAFAPEAWRRVPLAGEIRFALEEGRLAGSELLGGRARLRSESFSVEGERLALVDLEAEVVASGEIEGRWHLEADEHSQITGKGRYGIALRDYGAEAELRLDLASAGVVQRLLGAREIARLLPRRTEASLRAEGKLETATLRGEIDLRASDLSLAENAAPIRSLETSLAFTESSAEGTLALKSAPLDLALDLTWDGERLEIPRLVGSEGGAERFQGQASIPLSLAKLAPSEWFAQEETIRAELAAKSVPLDSLYRLVSDAPPLGGSVGLELTLGGTPAAPELAFEFEIADLSLTSHDQLAPAQVRLAARAEGESASLQGSFRHPDLNPLEIEAELPFRPGAWARGEREFLDEEVHAAASMERSPLDFLAQRVGPIQSIAGVLGIDATLAGTLRQPQLKGEGVLEISRLRLADRNAPSFYDIDLRTSFRDDRVTLEMLRAIIAGGEVEASGSLTLRGGEDPVIDLRASGREVLIFRTPDLSLRTDAELVLAGPWPQARLSGEIGITNSGYYKTFDLLPHALPTRNTSVLPTVERAPRGGGPSVEDLDFGIAIEPFRDWEIDLRVHTQEPFIVRSNLVTSDVALDLRLGGTLGRPVPRGYLAIDEGEFDLPFSSIDVEVGRLEFDDTTGFNGAIELKARARADQYRINVYLYNRLLDPKYVLTSTPPLPSEDLLSLLVTGSTRNEMLGAEAGSVAASRAATLLLRNLTRARDAADREPTLFDQLEDRTELDIRGINPETGAETVGGRIRLWRQLFFVGNVDTESDYRAVLKYVFRYR